jgi:ATP diphosphatase
LWAEIKASEKAAKAASQPGVHQPYSGILADIAITLPGLIRAVKLQEKAARAGFDWTDITDVIKKIREETDEVEEALKGDDPEAVAEEIGDLLFAVTSLARHRHRDPETIMRAANAKFERRFRYIEDELARRGQPFSATSLQEMEEIWIEAKTIERQGKT